MTVKEVLQKSIEFLKKKNIESAKLDAEILISESLGLKRLDLYLNFERPLDESELAGCREKIKRRGLGEPVSLVLGFQNFWGLNFFVNKNVLTPRPETEELVERAVQTYSAYSESEGGEVSNSSSGKTIVDLGAGSGCIGLTFLKKIAPQKFMTLVLIEKSKLAFEVLLNNTRRLFQNEIWIERELKSGWCFELSLSRQILCLNLPAEKVDEIFSVESGLAGKRIYILMANPPYIAKGDGDIAKEVLEHEPHEALFGGEEGPEMLKNWIKAYVPLMEEKSFLFMEMGASQGVEIKNFASSFGIGARVHKDMQGRDRIIEGQFTKERNNHG